MVGVANNLDQGEYVITGLAALLKRTGQIERSVELAALAVSHPQCGPIPREGAKKHLNELEDKLPQILSKKTSRFKTRRVFTNSAEITSLSR